MCMSTLDALAIKSGSTLWAAAKFSRPPLATQSDSDCDWYRKPLSLISCNLIAVGASCRRLLRRRHPEINVMHGWRCGYTCTSVCWSAGMERWVTRNVGPVLRLINLFLTAVAPYLYEEMSCGFSSRNTHRRVPRCFRSV
jgi:hypothetical protein